MVENLASETVPSSQPQRNYKSSLNQFRHGRNKLEIPISKEKLDEKVILKYLPSIIRKFNENVSDYKHLYNVYKGTSSILYKTRPFESAKPNNIIDERHIYSMVEFKKGYMYGDDVKYSCSDETACTDDISWINKYMKDQNKARKNVDIAEDVYITGAGNRFILPKTNGSIYDIKRNAPFDIYNLDYASSFIVYSSNYTKDKLFGAVITTIDSENENDIKYELMIYDYAYSYRFNCSNVFGSISNIQFIEKNRHYIGHCPFVEFKINKARMGIVEIVEPLFDAVNIISSNSVDNIVDTVNGILVVWNQLMDKKDKAFVDDTGTLVLTTNDPSRPADARYIVNPLNYGDVNEVKEAIIKTAYNIVGVPQATTQSTSGGDTGQARMLGGGWSRADVVAKQDELGLSEAESDMLEICIAIAEMNPQCPVNEVYASDIEINFCRNKNDNLLVKTQSLQSLVGMNMPKEVALNIVGVTANPHEVAQDWEEYDKSKKEEENSRVDKLGGINNGMQKETEKETKKIEE